jgi:phage/plasmid-like protein (TIGR03299 family)
MSALVEKMCHFGQMPWHGESESLVGNESAHDVMVKAGLDWTVKTEPLFRADGSEVSGRASIRESDDSVLGMVGPRWTPLQNRDAFSVFEPLVESGDMAWHTAGSLRDGQRVWVLCQLNLDNSEIVPNDEIAKFALLSNGHDGKLAVHFGFTPIRVVCANTEAMARQSSASKLIRVRHHRFVKENVDSLRDVMDVANQEFEATAQQYRMLASRQINQEDLKKYVKIVFGVGKKDDKDIGTRQQNILNKVENLFETGLGTDIPGVQGTWWGAYNAVTEYLNYEKGRTTANRLDSLWFGQNGVQNSNALESALLLAA